MTENSASLGVPPRAGPICKPPPGPNDISVLSKSSYGRSLSRDKAVIWRMSVNKDVCAAVGTILRRPLTQGSKLRVSLIAFYVALFLVALVPAGLFAFWLHSQSWELKDKISAWDPFVKTMAIAGAVIVGLASFERFTGTSEGHGCAGPKPQ
jgi:hypothetical protein